MKASGKFTILVQGHGFSCGECRVLGPDAEYEFFRRIEKEGFEATEVYIAERVDPAVVESWREKRRQQERRHEQEEAERLEREAYERLKAKFEGPI